MLQGGGGPAPPPQQATPAPERLRTGPGASRARPDEGDGRARSGRYRGHVDRRVQVDGRAIRAAEARALWRQHEIRLRTRGDGSGPVLLLGGSRGVSRHRVLQRLDAPLRRARRLRAGLCRGPRSRPSRAEPDGHHGQVRCAGAAHRRARPQRAFGAPRTAGRLLRRRLGPFRAARATCSSRATSTKACAPPPRSATTGSRDRPRARWCPSRSPTARPSSAPVGSRSASRPATCAAAIRSRHADPRLRTPGARRALQCEFCPEHGCRHDVICERMRAATHWSAIGSLALGDARACRPGQTPAAAPAPAAVTVPKPDCGAKPEHPGKLAPEAASRQWRTDANRLSRVLQEIRDGPARARAATAGCREYGDRRVQRRGQGNAGRRRRRASK